MDCRWLYKICIRFVALAACLPLFAQPHGQSGTNSSRPTFEVRWISDSHYGSIFSAHFELRAKYEIEETGVIKWLEGGLVSSKAVFEGQAATFADATAGNPNGTPLGPPASCGVQCVLDWAGQVQKEDDNNVKLELHTVPGFRGVSGPFDESTGCFKTALVVGGHDDNSFILSRKELGDLPTLRRKWSWTVDLDPATGCSETYTVAINLPTVQLKYGETSTDIASLKYLGGHESNRDPHIYVQVDNQGGKSWLEHANFAGEVWIDGVNQVHIDTSGKTDDPVTSDYEPHRKARAWAYDPANPSDGYRLQSPWGDDSRRKVQDWIDTPAVGSWGQGAPQTWGFRVKNGPPQPYGVLDEFLVEVKGWPGCGCVYVAFAMEVKPNAYRIKYSAPEEIDKDTWKQREQNPQPSVKLQFNGNEGWITVPGSQ